MEESARHIGFRFLNRFRCLAGACPETCCAGWSVPVDETRYAAIGQAMSNSAVEREEFARVFTPQTDPKYRAAALVVLRDGHTCSLLDEERLCSLQKRYGEALLPDICAAYPRVASRAFSRVEVAGSLSCPEMARLCLLEEDATEIIDLQPESLGRLRIFLELAQPRNLYEAALEDVRALALHYFAQRQYPMPSRLFFLTFFSHKSLPVLRREGGAEAGMRLARMMQDAGQAEVLAELHRKWSGSIVDTPFALSVITQLLSAAARAERHGFHRLLDEVVTSYAADANSGVTLDQSGAPRFDPALLRDAYYRRCAALPEALLSRVDLYFENFCTNHFFKDWYLRAPNLFQHVMSLIVRVATLRFLLFSHPKVVALAQSSDPIAAQLAVLDEVAVQVVYSVSRSLDHAEPIMNGLQTSLTEQGMETLAHAVCLLKI